jgi:hypothetical protein
MTMQHALRTLTLATAALVLTAPTPTYAAETPNGTTTERERGIVMECTGEADGLEVYTSIYENHRYGNYVQVVLGDPDAGNGVNKKAERAFLRDGAVRATVTIDGTRAKVRGTASKVGKKKHVHDELDDAGYHVTSDGTHRRLRNDLVLSYGGTLVPLTCDTAFAYDLTVTKTPIV